MPFPPDAKSSRQAAFAEHVLKAHTPEQASKDESQDTTGTKAEEDNGESA